MSEKRKSTSPNAIQMKNRRKTISIEKRDVISRIEKVNERMVDICHNVRFAHSCLPTRTVRNNDDRINPLAMEMDI